jgi:hypothetical protein
MTQIAQAACNKPDVTDPECADVLLLALTPAAYSSNNTADTPGRRAYISPAQVRLHFDLVNLIRLNQRLQVYLVRAIRSKIARLTSLASAHTSAVLSCGYEMSLLFVHCPALLHLVCSLYHTAAVATLHGGNPAWGSRATATCKDVMWIV